MSFLPSLFATRTDSIPIASSGHHARYGSLFLSVSGTYCIVPPLAAWVANNTAPLPRRAVALALLIAAANSGAILSTWLFGALSRAPRYTSATITLLVLQVGMLVCGVLAGAYLWRENRRKARARAQEEFSGEVGTSGPDLQNESVWFEYVM